MHDSLTPLGGMVPLIGMLVNETFGGIGVGIVNFLIFVLVTAFIAGLMVGRTPEIFRRKLGLAEIRLMAVAMLVTSFLILVPTALALGIDGLAGNSNPGFHGLTQVLYEYASAVANNGSGFEGLGDATVWWNVSASVCLYPGPVRTDPRAPRRRRPARRQAPRALERGEPVRRVARVRGDDARRHPDHDAPHVPSGPRSRTHRRADCRGAGRGRHAHRGDPMSTQPARLVPPPPDEQPQPTVRRERKPGPLVTSGQIGRRP